MNLNACGHAANLLILICRLFNICLIDGWCASETSEASSERSSQRQPMYYGLFCRQVNRGVAADAGAPLFESLREWSQLPFGQCF